MKYYKFTNKDSGATGVLPEGTINRIQANPKQAKKIEILHECTADGGPLPEKEIETFNDGNQAELNTANDVDETQIKNEQEQKQEQSESVDKEDVRNSRSESYEDGADTES